MKSNWRSWVTFRRIAAKSSSPSSRSAFTNVVCNTWNVSKCFSGRFHVLANALSRLTFHCRMVYARWPSRTIRICWTPLKCCGTQWRKSVFISKSIAFRLNLPRRNMAAKREYRFVSRSKPTWNVTFSKVDRRHRSDCWAGVLRQIRRRMRFRWSWSMRPPVKSKCSSWRVPIESTSKIVKRSRNERRSNRTSISPVMSARFWRTCPMKQSQRRFATVPSSECGWATHTANSDVSIALFLFCLFIVSLLLFRLLL